MPAVDKEISVQAFRELYQDADKNGKAGADACTPTPMTVLQNGIPIETVADGLCGFAWITIRPGNCPFANWLKKQGLARKAYGGGVQIWVGDYNQSHDKKYAYAIAFAQVLRAYGINANAGSRLD